MNVVVGLSQPQLDRVRATAAVLLPGSADSPAADAVPGFDELVLRAAGALEDMGPALAAAIDILPAEPTWANVSAFADREPSSFEVVALLVVGAYFMSPSVLGSLGLPTGARHRANPEQVVDELSTGILDAVFERGSPIRSLHDVNREALT